MKVLVIEDNVIHSDAAKAQLSEHDLTVVNSYDAGNKALGYEKHEFDVVLVDLMLPASSEYQSSKGLDFAGQEMPVGVFLAIKAAMHGAKFVAVLTDTNHHDHPASACLDYFGRHKPFMIGETKVIFTNDNCFLEDFERNLSTYSKTGEKSIEAKDWARLFLWLTANKFKKGEIKGGGGAMKW